MVIWVPVVKHTVAPFATRDGCVHHVSKAVLVIEHPLLDTMVFGREMDTLCRPSTFEHVLAAMWSFARTSDVFLDDGGLLNCRTAPKYPNVCFGLHRICTRLFGVKQTGTCSATNDTLHCGDNACAREPMLWTLVALMLCWFVVAPSDLK